MKKKKFLDEIKRSEGYSADYFMARYGNKLPIIFFPFALLLLAFFSMVFITLPEFCPWGRNVTTMLDIGVAMGAFIIGMLLFYEALNNMMVVLNAIIFFFSKVLNDEEHDFDRKTVAGLLVLLIAAMFYLVLGVIAAKLIGDNLGRAIVCMEG